ncbi:MAG: glycosyltransferase family 4 protein [Eubacteriales bacterium]|nr:glycosyltransferase family 4 protein [Eubacteriales bacterium]MDD4540718.1 glycosyltransferase family 4 protein [Eubacteriales bacterium]
MKIGIFSDAYLPQIGGVSTASHLIKKHLTARGHKVYVITPSDPKEEAEANVIRVPSMPFVSAKRLALLCPPLTYRRIKNLDLDLVHSQTEFAMGDLARRISKDLNIPHIHTFHTLYEDWLLGQLGEGLASKAARNFIRRFSTNFCNSVDHIIVPTHKTEKVLLSYGVTTPLQILPTGIELDRFSALAADPDSRLLLREELGIPQAAFVLIYVGRISHEKGIDEILEYLPRLVAENENFYFVLAGSGPQLQEYCKQVSEAGLEKNVKFIGPVPPAEVPRYYAMGDAFASASRSETQGLTYIEAMATGLPLLVVNDDSLAGVFNENVNGFSFTSAEEFQQGVRILMAEPERRKQMSEAAIATSKRFSVELFAEQILDIYQNQIEMHQMSRSKTASQSKILNFFKEKTANK